jgi:hypothetical protein
MSIKACMTPILAHRFGFVWVMGKSSAGTKYKLVLVLM